MLDRSIERFMNEMGALEIRFSLKENYKLTGKFNNLVKLSLCVFVRSLLYIT